MDNRYTNNDLIKMDKMKSIMSSYNIEPAIINNTVLDIFDNRYLVNIDSVRPYEFYTQQDIRKIWESRDELTNSKYKSN